jgi:hypothetical protein
MNKDQFVDSLSKFITGTKYSAFEKRVHELIVMENRRQISLGLSPIIITNHHFIAVKEI